MDFKGIDIVKTPFLHALGQILSVNLHEDIFNGRDYPTQYFSVSARQGYPKTMHFEPDGRIL